METEIPAEFSSTVDDDIDSSRQPPVANSGSTTLIFGIFIPLVMVDIILSNGIVLITLLTSKKLRALPCFAILVSLTVSDFLTGWTLTLYWISRLTFQTTPLLACKVLIIVSSASVMCSINHCVVIAADRLYAVLSPFEYKTKKSGIRPVGILFGIWLVSAILPATVVATNSVRGIDDIGLCNPSSLWSGRSQIVSGFALIYFLVAYAVICLSYTFIYIKIRDQEPFEPANYTKCCKFLPTFVRKSWVVDRGGPDDSLGNLAIGSQDFRGIGPILKMVSDGKSHINSTNEPERTKYFKHTHISNERRSSISSFKKRNKIRKMLFITTGLMLICFLPSMCCYSLRALGLESPTLDSSESWAYCMVSINSAINPLLYAMKLPGFKKAFLKMFKTWKGDLIGTPCKA